MIYYNNRCSKSKSTLGVNICFMDFLMGSLHSCSSFREHGLMDPREPTHTSIFQGNVETNITSSPQAAVSLSLYFCSSFHTMTYIIFILSPATQGKRVTIFLLVCTRMWMHSFVTTKYLLNNCTGFYETLQNGAFVLHLQLINFGDHFIEDAHHS